MHFCNGKVEISSCCTTNCRPFFFAKPHTTNCRLLHKPAQIVVDDNLCCSCRSQFLISQMTICAGKMKPNCTNWRLSVAVFKLQKIMTITKMIMMMMMMISVGGLEAGLVHIHMHAHTHTHTHTNTPNHTLTHTHPSHKSLHTHHLHTHTHAHTHTYTHTYTTHLN